MKMWITRSTYGSLKIHFDEPCKIVKERQDEKYGWWESEHYNVIRFIDPFPEVTFENSPMEVELKLINK